MGRKKKGDDFPDFPDVDAAEAEEPVLPATKPKGKKGKKGKAAAAFADGECWVDAGAWWHVCDPAATTHILPQRQQRALNGAAARNGRSSSSLRDSCRRAAVGWPACVSYRACGCQHGHGDACGACP
jgi:hypothetical protein